MPSEKKAPTLAAAHGSMPFDTKELTLVAVHGEGDRAKVNELADYRRRIKLQSILASGANGTPELHQPSDEPPEVMLVLADQRDLERRVEWPLRTWDEVEAFKAAGHWDSERKQFIFSHWDDQQQRHVPFGSVMVTLV